MTAQLQFRSPTQDTALANPLELGDIYSVVPFAFRLENTGDEDIDDARDMSIVYGGSDGYERLQLMTMVEVAAPVIGMDTALFDGAAVIGGAFVKYAPMRVHVVYRSAWAWNVYNSVVQYDLCVRHGSEACAVQMRGDTGLVSNPNMFDIAGIGGAPYWNVFAHDGTSWFRALSDGSQDFLSSLWVTNGNLMTLSIAQWEKLVVAPQLYGADFDVARMNMFAPSTAWGMGLLPTNRCRIPVGDNVLCVGRITITGGSPSHNVPYYNPRQAALRVMGDIAI